MRWTCSAYWVDFSTITSGLLLAEYSYLADISKIDKESDMFRYPFGNNLNVLFDKQTHISLVATHDNMNNAFNILSELYKTGNFTEQEYEAYIPQLIIEEDITTSKAL